MIKLVDCIACDGIGFTERIDEWYRWDKDPHAICPICKGMGEIDEDKIVIASEVIE